MGRMGEVWMDVVYIRMIMVVYLGLLFGAITSEFMMICVRNIKKVADNEGI
jgi:hypothetical protein